MSVGFLYGLVTKWNLRLRMQRLASELGCLDLLMPVFENYCKKLIMDINVSLDVISTYTLSCIVFRESEKSLDFK